MTYEQYRKTLEEQSIKHHDMIRIDLYKEDGTIGSIEGIINTKINPCELCLSIDTKGVGVIDTDFVHGIQLDKIVSIEVIKQ